MHFLLIASCRLSYKYLNIFDYLSWPCLSCVLQKISQFL